MVKLLWLDGALLNICKVSRVLNKLSLWKNKYFIGYLRKIYLLLFEETEQQESLKEENITYMIMIMIMIVIRSIAFLHNYNSA